MLPRQFIAYQERRLSRSLTPVEREAVQRARAACTTGKRDTVKAMRVALETAAEMKANVARRAAAN